MPGITPSSTTRKIVLPLHPKKEDLIELARLLKQLHKRPESIFGHAVSAREFRPFEELNEILFGPTPLDLGIKRSTFNAFSDLHSLRRDSELVMSLNLMIVTQGVIPDQIEITLDGSFVAQANPLWDLSSLVTWLELSEKDAALLQEAYFGYRLNPAQQSEFLLHQACSSFWLSAQLGVAATVSSSAAFCASCFEASAQLLYQAAHSGLHYAEERAPELFIKESRRQDTAPFLALSDRASTTAVDDDNTLRLRSLDQ